MESSLSIKVTTRQTVQTRYHITKKKGKEILVNVLPPSMILFLDLQTEA